MAADQPKSVPWATIGILVFVIVVFLAVVMFYRRASDPPTLPLSQPEN